MHTVSVCRMFSGSRIRKETKSHTCIKHTCLFCKFFILSSFFFLSITSSRFCNIFFMIASVFLFVLLVRLFNERGCKFWRILAINCTKNYNSSDLYQSHRWNGNNFTIVSWNDCVFFSFWTFVFFLFQSSHSGSIYWCSLVLSCEKNVRIFSVF